MEILYRYVVYETAVAEKLDKNTEIEKPSKALKLRRVVSAMCIVCAHGIAYVVWRCVCTRKTKIYDYEAQRLLGQKAGGLPVRT